MNNIIYTKVSDLKSNNDNDTIKLINEVNKVNKVNKVNEEYDFSLLENTKENFKEDEINTEDISIVDETLTVEEKINDINNLVKNNKNIIPSENSVIGEFYNIKFTKNTIIFMVLMILALSICCVSIIKIE